MPNHGTGQLNVSIDADLKKRFREVAKENGTSATTLIQRWVQQYIDSNGKATNLTQPNHNLEHETTTALDLEARLKAIEKFLGFKVNHEPQTRPVEEITDSVQSEPEKTIKTTESSNEEQFQTGQTENETKPEVLEQENNSAGSHQQLSFPSQNDSQQEVTEMPSEATESIGEDISPESESPPTVEPKSEGLKGTELAKRLGVDKSYITYWKQGKNIPQKTTAKYYPAYQEWLNWKLVEGKWHRTNS